ISDLFEQLEAAVGTADPRWLQARWARVLEAARPLTPEGGPAAPQEESAAPGPLALESPTGVVARCGGRSGPGHRPEGPGTAHSGQGVGAGAPPGPLLPGCAPSLSPSMAPGQGGIRQRAPGQRGRGGRPPHIRLPLLPLVDEQQSGAER
ncbi:hypothetical protein PRIEUP_LOCUS11974, partial [Pristimantis euphronides]